METIMEVSTTGQVNNIYLIRKAQRGDKEAIEYIITRFIPFIIKTCRKIYVKGYELEDLIQVGKVSIINAINKYKINRGDAFTTYVANAVKLNLYRLIKYRVNSISEISIDIVESNKYKEIKALASKSSIEDDIIKNEEKCRLYYEINQLSHNEKELIYWFYFEDKTLEEYAREKGICYSSAVKRKRNAIKKLRYQMS